MVCLSPEYMYLPKSHPIDQFADFFEHKFRKTSLTPRKGYYQVLRPCGHCLGCYLDHANEWATRIYCETQTNPIGMFLTLTYRPQDLPINEKGNSTLVKEHTQKFWHDLRQKHPECKIKYLIAGEYGNKATKRPHYHACVWGYIPSDLKFYKPSKADKNCKLFKSKEIYDIWAKGMIIIGKLEYRSACYVARYVQKKAKSQSIEFKWDHNNISTKERYTYTQELNSNPINVNDILNYYENYTQKYKYGVTPDINNIIKTAIYSTFKKVRHYKKEDTNRLPEFILCSNRPAIGMDYWKINKEKIKRNSGIYINYDGKIKLKPIPRYFKKLWEAEDWEEYYRWKYQQQKQAEINIENMLSNIKSDKKFIEQKKSLLLQLSAINLKERAKALQRDNFT